VKRGLAERFIDQEIEDAGVVVFWWKMVKCGNG
jgi:hypothetical protein